MSRPVDDERIRVRVTFCGVRGSTPAPGPDFLRYGGHTSCVHVESSDGRVLLLDAGTGMQAVSSLVEGPFDGSVLLGHLHWDHTYGMPFFAAGTRPGARVSVLLPRQQEPAESLLARFMSPPSFPILPAQLGPGWSFGDLDEGEHQIEGFTVLAREIPHKGGRTFGYRVTDPAGGSLAYLSDHSPSALGPGPDGYGARHPAALELAHGVGLLIHDAQHRADQFPAVEYLGHAAAEYPVALGAQAGAAEVMLFHHDPRRTDDEVDAILADAVRSGADLGVRVSAAAEGRTYTL